MTAVECHVTGILIIEDLLLVGQSRVGLLDRAATHHAINEMLYLISIVIFKLIFFTVGLLCY